MRIRALRVVLGIGVLLAGCGDDGGQAAETGSTTDAAGSTTTSTSAAPGSSSTGAASSSSTSSATTEPGSSTTADGSSTGAPNGCEAPPMAPGEYTNLELDVDGRTRNYTVFVPASYDGSTPTSLVFNFHGFSSNAAQQVFFSDFNVEAEERGVVVVYPNGVGSSWNAGGCCGDAQTEAVDDVAFVRALLDEVSATLCIDHARVYATGMSNGGFFSHRLACDASDIIAAIGPVAGALVLAPEDCAPTRPVPVIHFHGTEDEVVPYAGGNNFPGVEASLQAWAQRNACDATSSVSFEMDDVSCQTWDNCDAEATVTLCTLDAVGHCWPGQAFCPTGESTLTIRANAMMLDLFEQHTL
jgi:polyhydroxybutyrate depolymerase